MEIRSQGVVSTKNSIKLSVCLAFVIPSRNKWRIKRRLHKVYIYLLCTLEDKNVFNNVHLFIREFFRKSAKGHVLIISGHYGKQFFVLITHPIAETKNACQML